MKFPVVRTKLSPLWFTFIPWLLVLLLWKLDITVYTERSFLEVLWALVPPLGAMAVGMALIGAARLLRPRAHRSAGYDDHAPRLDGDVLSRILNLTLYIYFGIFMLEVAVFMQIPLISMLMGADVTHFDFGLPGVHGFLFALGSALSTAAFAAFKITRDKKYLTYIYFSTSILLLLLTRKILLVIGIQLLIIEIIFSGYKNFWRLLAVAVLGVFLFGWLGDLRSGREAFLALAGLNSDYPEYLPSGLIWVYIYAVTPIANYLNMTELVVPTFQPFDLVGWVIPGRLLTMITGIEVPGGFENDWQVSNAFNVASGFANIYPTLGGTFGVAVFALLMGMVCSKYQDNRSFFGILTLSTIYSCSTLMVFNNNFMSLNVIFQLVIYSVMHKAYRARVRYRSGPEPAVSGR